MQLNSFIKNTLASKYWRLNNLYHIINKQGNLVILKLNKAQQLLYSVEHPRTIIPKSRQQGISTYKVEEALDSCLFTPYYQAGIQSYGLIETGKLYVKALIMWDNLDPLIKQLLGIKLVSSNKNGLTFSNGASLRIGNFRGDTLNSLHISELAKIDNKFPERSRELKTGAFQAVAVGNKISIESTAEGTRGLFYETTMMAAAQQDASKALTPLDFKLVFLSWLDDPDCSLEEVPDLPDSMHHIVDYCNKYFSKLPYTVTQQQKNWYIAKYKELGDDIKQEYPATLEEAFEQSIKGTIYHKEYKSLVQTDRIQPNLLVRGAETIVSYDIGVDDTTELLFEQQIDGEPRIVLEYHNNNEPLAHYVEVMQQLAEQYSLNITDVILPHDGRVKEFIAGKRRVDAFRDLGVPAYTLDKLSILDGIEATRDYLRRVRVDSSCDRVISAIQLYRWKYDAKNDITLNEPLHNWTSNPMDALRYMALGSSSTQVSIPLGLYTGV